MQFDQYDKDGYLMQCDVYLDDCYEYNYHLNYAYNLSIPKIIWHSAIQLSKGELIFVNKAILGLVKTYPRFDGDYLVTVLDSLSDILINDVEDLLTNHLKDIKQMPDTKVFDIVIADEEPSPQDIVDDIVDQTSPTDKSEAVTQIKKSYQDVTPDKDTGVPQGLINQLADILKK